MHVTDLFNFKIFVSQLKAIGFILYIDILIVLLTFGLFIYYPKMPQYQFYGNLEILLI